jgi:hypothetical protein
VLAFWSYKQTKPAQAMELRSSYGRTPCQASPSGLLVVVLLGSRSRRTRQDASTTSHSHMRGLRVAQSRMTVLRREATLSYRASRGSRASLSQSCGACPPDRACLHPSTATPKVH